MGNRLRRFLLNTARVIFVVVIAALVAPVHAQVDPRYQGEYRDGKKNGLGVYTFPGGNRYEGEFRDDKMNGRGVYTFTDGNRYEGEFRDGKRNGRGVFTFANRNRYEGEYRDDKFHGRGVFTFANGYRYEGEFQDNKMHGRGVFTFTSGDRFEGEFRDDKRNGRGVYTFASGTRDEGEYRDGKIFHGQRTDAGGIIVATYTNGERAIATPGSAGVAAPPSQGGSSTPGSPVASAGSPSPGVRQPAAAAPEKGKGANPTLTVADLAACKKEITELHRLSIAAARNSVQEYCTKLERDKYPDNCKNMTKGLQEITSMSDMNWYLKGNESCSGPEYPCWGLQGMETLADLLVNNVFPPTGEKFGDHGFVVQKCVARLWIAKRDGISPASAAANKGGSKSSASSPITVSTAASDNPSPASPASIAPAQAMSPQQIASCSEEIKRAQVESQSWTGNVNDVAARLGRFQKDLFEGRCAGHPEAQAYIAGANKMLAYGGAPGGAPKQKPGSGGVDQGTASGNLAPLRPDTKSTEHNHAHNATNCIQIFHEDEMKARGLRTIMRSIMVNNCPFSISVLWCVVGDKRGPGDCNPGYSNLADLDARGSRGIDSDNQAVHFAACRLGKNMGFQPVEKDPRHPFRFSCS